MVGESFVDIFQHGMMDSLLMRDIEALTQSDRLMNSSTRPVVGRQSLITPMTVHIESDINRFEEHRLAQRPLQQLLETTYQ